MTRVLISLVACCILSCSKKESHMYTAKVQLRIENATGFTLENVAVGDSSFGDIENHQATGYKLFNEPLYAGYCIFTRNGIPVFAGLGVCGIPLPPPFDPGYYTFKVMPAVNGYHSITIIPE